MSLSICKMCNAVESYASNGDCDYCTECHSVEQGFDWYDEHGSNWIDENGNIFNDDLEFIGFQFGVKEHV